MIARIIEHRSPTRRRRRDAQSEKTQRCLGKNRHGHSNAGLNQNWLNDVRQNMTNKNSWSRRPQRTSAFNKLQRLDLQNLSSRKPRVSDPTDGGQRKNQAIDSWPKKSNQGDRQQNSGKSHQ